MNIETSIIIPTYNHWELSLKWLANLSWVLPYEGVEVIWIDDSDEEACLNNASWWIDHFIKKLHYTKTSGKIGFPKSANLGVSKSVGEYVVILTSDVAVKTKEFIDHIHDDIKGDDKVLTGGRVLNWDTGWNTFKIGTKNYTIPYCEGYLLACTRKAWDSLEGFDERFSPYDYEDMDISMKALEQGFQLHHLPDTDYFHQNGGTILMDDVRRNITLNHRDVFFEKWKDKIPTIMNARIGAK